MATIADIKHIYSKDRYDLTGVSTKEKPKNVPINTKCLDLDTGTLWYYPGPGYQWTPIGRQAISDESDIDRINREMATDMIVLYWNTESSLPPELYYPEEFERKVADNTFLCFKVFRYAEDVSNITGVEYLYPITIQNNEMYFTDNSVFVQIHRYSFETHSLS